MNMLNVASDGHAFEAIFARAAQSGLLLDSTQASVQQDSIMGLA